MRHPGRVVGDTELDRRDGEGRLGCADRKIASHGQVTGRAPDAAVQHGDHRHLGVPDAVEDSFESRRPGHGVVAVQWYFADVVTRRPDLRIWIRPDDDDPDTGLL